MTENIKCEKEARIANGSSQTLHNTSSWSICLVSPYKFRIDFNDTIKKCLYLKNIAKLNKLF